MRWTGFHGKTLWDWLQLLVVPLVLALAAFGLSVAQSDRDQRQEERRARQERFAAADRAQEEALRTYLQQISNLITDHGLATSERRQVQQLARTLTLTTLRRLDSERKGVVLRFLFEGDLINATVLWYRTPQGRVGAYYRFPKVSLDGADLRGVVVPRYLAKPDEDPRRTTAAYLRGADLRNADFREVTLVGASLEYADLRGADFTGARLAGGSFAGACLSGARFARATDDSASGRRFAISFEEAAGRDVDFSGAELGQARFNGARLADVNLSGADTSGTGSPNALRSSDERADCEGLTP